MNNNIEGADTLKEVGKVDVEIDEQSKSFRSVHDQYRKEKTDLLEGLVLTPEEEKLKEEALELFHKMNGKKGHPLYQTANSEYGKKELSEFDRPTMYAGRSGHFTSVCMMYDDFG